MSTNNPWKVLEPTPAAMLGRRVDARHPREWFWCTDPGGRYGLALYGVSGRELPPDLTELHGMRASIREKSDGTHFLLLILSSGADWELFHALCEDLVESTLQTTSSDDAVDVAITRLRRWQRFLSRGRRPGLTDEEARGLLGELLFMREDLIPRTGIGAAIQGWAGPDGHPQDFAIGERAFEVKARLSSARQVVEISSAEQLESSSKFLFLVVQELVATRAGTAGSVTLTEVVEAIRKLAKAAGIAVADRFADVMDELGYEDNRKYGAAAYLDSGRRYFRVADDFPRIVRTKVPRAIPRVRYALDVSECISHEVTDPWA